MRLAALGRVQSLVGDGMSDEIDLGEIARLELQAMGAPVDGKVAVNGPRVPLGFELVQTFALALHELATNTMKYGALKEESGRLVVSWEVNPRQGEWWISGAQMDREGRSGHAGSLAQRLRA